MLPLIHPTPSVPQPPFPSLEALLEEPFPRPPEDLLQLEQRLSTAAVQGADQLGLVPVTRAQADEACVRPAMAHVRAPSPVPLGHQGCRTTSVRLLGGTCLVLETPSRRADRCGRRERRRRTRGPHGAGDSPVLAALGIAARVRPARRSALARHGGPAARDRAAAARLARRGLAGDVSSRGRISTAPAETRSRLRDGARAAALRLPVPPPGPWAGPRVRVSRAGGRGRTRRRRRGRQPATGRHGVSTPWREPRRLVSALLEAQGPPARLRVPLSAVLLGAAAAVGALRRGSWRRLGAAAADGVECRAAGAAWIGHRVERQRTLAEMLAAKRVAVRAFSHASPSLSAPMATGRRLSKAQCRAR